jgi:hypothetical protein
MVQCITTFMEAIYVACWNAISTTALQRFRDCVDSFCELWDIFITTGVRVSISLPCQHALFHYYLSIQLFGSPNGLCSSITESKHIKAVKESWQCSSRDKALNQMLCTIVRLDKMTALWQIFDGQGMLVGTTSSYMAGMVQKGESDADSIPMDEDDEDNGGPVDGSPSNVLSDVKLASQTRM